MPFQTFFNLQKDKQNKIITASKEEFSKYSFYDASINRIIKEASISRGSFYQYFENKEDLFIYILDEFKYRMLESLAKNIKGKKYDIFEFLTLVYDFITEDTANSEDRDFIITTVSNMDIKLLNHLFAFLKPDNFLKYKDYFIKLVDVSSLKVKDFDELISLNSMLMNIMMNQISIFFSNMCHKEKCREDLIRKFKFIKYGVIEK